MPFRGPSIVANPGGMTVVTNAGSNGKFLAVLDLEIGKGELKDIRYRLLPVFSDLLKPDGDMQALIDRLRAPYAEKFGETLATAEQLLYRRGNFIGPMDQVICDALRRELDAQIALSPGFRWGATVLAGQAITMEDVLAETAISYPEVYVQDMTGSAIKAILEDVCDNLFNPDPVLSAGRRYGARRRHGLCVRAGRVLPATGYRTCGLMTARRWKPARAIASPAGRRSTRSRASRSATCWRRICGRKRP